MEESMMSGIKILEGLNNIFTGVLVTTLGYIVKTKVEEYLKNKKARKKGPSKLSPFELVDKLKTEDQIDYLLDSREFIGLEVKWVLRLDSVTNFRKELEKRNIKLKVKGQDYAYIFSIDGLKEPMVQIVSDGKNSQEINVSKQHDRFEIIGTIKDVSPKKIQLDLIDFQRI